MAEDFSAMTVNERLFAAGLLAAFDEAVQGGNLAEINHVLARVGLWQDDNGMNWSIANDKNLEGSVG